MISLPCAGSLFPSPVSPSVPCRCQHVCPLPLPCLWHHADRLREVRGMFVSQRPQGPIHSSFKWWGYWEEWIIQCFSSLPFKKDFLKTEETTVLQEFRASGTISLMAPSWPHCRLCPWRSARVNSFNPHNSPSKVGVCYILPVYRRGKKDNERRSGFPKARE